MARSTERLLLLPCPMCGLELQIHVRGLGHEVKPQAWIDEQSIEVWEFIHDEHTRVDSTVVDGSRNRARQIIG